MTTSDPIVVDANVAVKWLFDEDGWQPARALYANARANRTPILTPVYFEGEVVNAIWRKTARGLISHVEGLAALAAFDGYPTLVTAPAGLSRMAYNLAEELWPGALYDMYYAALAQVIGCAFWTADARLARALSAVPIAVRLLDDFR